MLIYGGKKIIMFSLFDRFNVHKTHSVVSSTRTKKRNKHTKDLHTSLTERLDLSKRQNVAIVYRLLISPVFLCFARICVKWNPLYPALLPHTYTLLLLASKKKKKRGGGEVGIMTC